MALLFSVAEYCSSVWEESTNCRLADIKLRKGLRINTGIVNSTKIQWLPVLANIYPSHIRQQNTVLRVMNKIQNNAALPIHEDGVTTPRLMFHHSFLASVRSIKVRRCL
ncbi:Hypothetical protein CINCED_3A021124 [Cinara cedri]|uniref:Uncharacterized protein n=1 Tax=Cinara cedri TaxID=506608 RepID=A0A5E4MJW4_9HEMI|nr:Hypothetical protein CINCED_3A021124 [Cinara cedri]